MAKRTSCLLVIDVINDLNFPGGENVEPWARRMVPRLHAVRGRAHRQGVPVIYVNDNFGHWQDDFAGIVRHCTRTDARGRTIAQKLRPTAGDYFILKPKHSAFYATSIEPLLEHLKIDHLILAGIATNLCVLFTAHDAHMRGYKLTALSDCCAAESDEDHNIALDQLERFCNATICTADELKF
ncbi:MAG: isochorismatase family cysteine hydrolase [Tepidisphaeraceae bacterium]